MPSSLAQETQRRLESYVEDGVSLRDLWVWLMSNVVVTQADQADADLRAVLGDTILYLFEYTGGYIDEERVRSYIGSLLDAARLSAVALPASAAVPSFDTASVKAEA